MKIRDRFLVGLALITFGCDSEYKKDAKQIIDLINYESNMFIVQSDSLIIDRQANPTRMRLEFDTIIEEITDEEDFLVIQYNSGHHLLQRIEADDLMTQKIYFSKMKFMRGDTITAGFESCNHIPSKECYVTIK